jgi:hypothetical protein
MAVHPTFYTNYNTPNYAWLSQFRDISSFPVMNMYITPETNARGMIALASWCLVTGIHNINSVSHTVTPTLSNANYLAIFGDEITDLKITGITFANITTDQLTPAEMARLHGDSPYTDASEINVTNWFNAAPPSGLSALYAFYIANRIKSHEDMSQPIDRRPWMKHITIVLFRQPEAVNDWRFYPIRIKGFLCGLDIKITDSVLMKCEFTLFFKALPIVKSKNIGFSYEDVRAGSQGYYTQEQKPNEN